MTATGTEAGTRVDIAPDIEDVMALSPLQEGLYSLTALAEFAEGEPADDPYVIGMAADISGALDVALLRDCAATMLTRHPNLRASFFSRGIRAARADRAVAGRAAMARRRRARTRTWRRWKPRSGDGRSTSSGYRRSVSCSSNCPMRDGVW